MKSNDVNWNELFKNFEPESRKQRLIRECKKYDVTPYIDDPSENASGNNVMRGVASEAEIERRLSAKKAVLGASRANIIALLAFFVASFSLGISLYEKLL
ncbi:hypothetical protein [Pseudidiomarina salinarum]|nr:hypothetical protein [Pseudidiomarina salinarum]